MFNIAEKTTAKKARVKGIEVGGKQGPRKNVMRTEQQMIKEILPYLREYSLYLRHNI